MHSTYLSAKLFGCSLRSQLSSWLVSTFSHTHTTNSFSHFNNVTSGFIESDMTKDLDTEKLLPFIPLKRFGTAEEVAGECVLLLLIVLVLVLVLLLSSCSSPCPSSFSSASCFLLSYLLLYCDSISWSSIIQRISPLSCYIFFVFILSPFKTYHRKCSTSHHYHLVSNICVLTFFLQDW